MIELKGVSESIVVQCPTIELAEKVLTIADRNKYKWMSGDDLLPINKERYESFNKRTCYKFYNEGHVTQSPIEKWLREYHKIITAEEFIRLNTVREFTTDIAIHCPTEELADKILKLAYEAGYTWDNGRTNINCWNNLREGTHYTFWEMATKEIAWGNGHSSQRNREVIKAEDFLNKYSEEVVEQIKPKKVVEIKVKLARIL